MTKINKGEEYVQPIPFDGEDEKREVKKPKNTKDEYIDAVIKDGVRDIPARSLYELNELGKLASEQFDDMNTFNIKSEVIPKTHNDKGIDYVQAGLKADTLWNERPLNECAELGLLIRAQFDDDTSNVKSEVIPCQII